MFGIGSKKAEEVKKPKKLWFKAKSNQDDSIAPGRPAETPGLARPQRKLWFRAKTYGWGWIPVTWQGWLVMAIYLFCVAYYAKDVGNDGLATMEKFAQFFVGLGGLSVLLLWVCNKKGERPHWSWGKSDTDKSKNGH